MSSRHFVKIQSEQFNEGIEIEMPGDQPLKELLPDLLKVLNWPEKSGDQPINYCLWTTEKQRVDLSDTLVGAGIENFQTVWIAPEEQDVPGAGSQSEQVQTAMPPKADAPQPPLWEQIPIKEPALIHPSGVVFVLGEPPVLIGRYDEGMPVGIDLTELEKETFISSRRHARILKDGKNYILEALKTTNGTLVNTQSLQPGEKIILKDKTRIQFGFQGVVLIFRLPPG